MSFLINTVFDHILVSYSSTSVSPGWVGGTKVALASISYFPVHKWTVPDIVSGHSRHKRVNELSSSKQ